jgi:hypothetical protein
MCHLFSTRNIEDGNAWTGPLRWRDLELRAVRHKQTMAQLQPYGIGARELRAGARRGAVV